MAGLHLSNTGVKRVVWFVIIWGRPQLQYCGKPNVKNWDKWLIRHLDPIRWYQIFHSKRGAGGFSASSTKLASVRTTSSTFSRKALTVNLTNLTVRVSNLLLKNELSHAACNGEKKETEHVRNQFVSIYTQFSFHGLGLQLLVDIDNLFCYRSMFRWRKWNLNPPIWSSKRGQITLTICAWESFLMTTYTVCQSDVDIMMPSDFVSGLGLTTDENLKTYSW